MREGFFERLREIELKQLDVSSTYYADTTEYLDRDMLTVEELDYLVDVFAVSQYPPIPRLVAWLAAREADRRPRKAGRMLLRIISLLIEFRDAETLMNCMTAIQRLCFSDKVKSLSKGYESILFPFILKCLWYEGRLQECVRDDAMTQILNLQEAGITLCLLRKSQIQSLRTALEMIGREYCAGDETRERLWQVVDRTLSE